MQERLPKIGIAGGTFDPIHYGHLIIAEEIRESCGLDKVLFIPSGNPPHKDTRCVTSAEHRFNMVAAAISTNGFFEASRLEMERTGYAYTVDTLQELRNLYGENVGLYFIIGADVVWDLLKWKQPERLFAMCEFIVAFRPACRMDSFVKEVEMLRTKHSARINIADTPVIDISSTAIRERAKTGRSLKYLVPEAVEDYILQNGLYL